MTETTSNGRKTMIRLEQLVKRFPGQQQPAVEDLTMEIPEGEIVIFVGPSGCGKTTTMKMINRIIEPTSGRIFLEGDDVTKVNPDQLRRRIGYVIQQIGLFPHMTIADNVATVPRLLGWDDKRTKSRVDELLETVGMDPAQYRDRYPKELSGGQRQRVGVARAMSADPPVMLMDEPFGAIDPITRDRLQNEFLRLQRDIRKTIVFVTHDIDEAIKMGDRIAILQERSRIAQFDKPEQILTAPANEFVEDFIGSGRSLKRLNLSRVRDIELSKEWPVARVDDNAEDVRQRLHRSDKNHMLVVDHQQRPQRWVDVRSLERTDNGLHQAGEPVDAIVQAHTTLRDALNEMLTSQTGSAVVVDDSGAYQGEVDLETIMAAVQQMRREAAEVDRARKEMDAAPGEVVS